MARVPPCRRTVRRRVSPSALLVQGGDGHLAGLEARLPGPVDLVELEQADTRVSGVTVTVAV